MALKGFSLSLIFFVLLFSHVFARELQEKSDEKNANVNVEDASIMHPSQLIPWPRPTPIPWPRPTPIPWPRPTPRPWPRPTPICRYYCRYRCCSVEEFAIFSQTQKDNFNDDKHGANEPGYGYIHGHGYGYEPRPGFGYIP